MTKKLVSTLCMPHEKWLEYRRMGLGGSDAATLAGLNPYGSLLSLYVDKLGIAPEKEDNEAMRIGRDLEDYVASRWREKTGKKPRCINYMFQHELYEFMLANIDRDVVGENAGLECKTTLNREGWDYKHGEIPPRYYAQCQWYMAVKEYDCMYLAVLVFGEGLYDFTVERDDAEIEVLQQMASDFWIKHVLAKVPPEPDGSEASAKALKVLYPAKQYVKDTETAKMLACDNAVELYDSATKQMKELKAIQERAKQEIAAALGDDTAGFVPKFDVTYRPQSRRDFDADRLCKDNKAIYDKYLKTSTYRVMRLKERKEA